MILKVCDQIQDPTRILKPGHKANASARDRFCQAISDISYAYLAQDLNCFSFELSNFLSAPYHHQGSWWDWLLVHLIRLTRSKNLIYHKAILLKIWFVALLRLQISSLLHIIIKGLDKTGCWFICFVIQRQKFWYFTKPFISIISKCDLLSFWAYKIPHCFV